MVKSLTLSEECASASTSDQVRTDCNLTALIWTRVDLVSVARIVDDRGDAHVLALAFSVEVEAMACDPWQENRVKVCVSKGWSRHTVQLPNDPSSVTRPTRASDCNCDARAGLDARG